MHPELKKRYVESVRQRVFEGDCPVTQRLGIESLEHLVCALADELDAKPDTSAAEKSEPVAWQLCRHGLDIWSDIPKELFGINPNRFKYRELYTHAAPRGADALRSLSYDALFNAIAKATHISGGSIAISVKDFREAIDAAISGQGG